MSLLQKNKVSSYGNLLKKIERLKIYVQNSTRENESPILSYLHVVLSGKRSKKHSIRNMVFEKINTVAV